MRTIQHVEAGRHCLTEVGERAFVTIGETPGEQQFSVPLPRVAAVALGDHYLDGAGRTTRPVTADNAREAAESYYRRMVMRGEAPEWTYAGGERVIVEHPRGPKVDPSVTWHRDEDGGAPFVAFTVRVLSVDVAAEAAP